MGTSRVKDYQVKTGIIIKDSAWLVAGISAQFLEYTGDPIKEETLGSQRFFGEDRVG